MAARPKDFGALLIVVNFSKEYTELQKTSWKNPKDKTQGAETHWERKIRRGIDIAKVIRWFMKGKRSDESQILCRTKREMAKAELFDSELLHLQKNNHKPN